MESHFQPTSKKEGMLRGDNQLSSPSSSSRLISRRTTIPSSLSSRSSSLRRNVILGQALSRSASQDRPLNSPPVLGKRKTTSDEATSPSRRVRLRTSVYSNDDSPQRYTASSHLSTTGRLLRTCRSLVISETVLGFGSDGTIVFKGSYKGRAVAVKQAVKHFVTIANKEIKALAESDYHPNVIQYYYHATDSNFLFIALDLCPATLVDIVERPNDFADIVATFEPKSALRQITSGLRHLHSLQIIHRYIKPQNILVSPAGQGNGVDHRMLISDFGVCKKLEAYETSYEPSLTWAGTTGWCAPEVIRGDVKIARRTEDMPEEASPKGRLVRESVDIFPLGCLFYYVLTRGRHPFGDYPSRDHNILNDTKFLHYLPPLQEGIEAEDLIARMLSPEACERPDTSTCLLHPYLRTA